MKGKYRRYIYYIRWAVGLFLLLLGALFIFIPFIPLGYAFIISAILILGPQLPFYRRMINWLIKKDKSGKISRIERKIGRWEDQVEMKVENWLKKD